MFPPEVSELLKFYVYRLIDPRNGETFYLGKGTGNRVFQHAAGEVSDDAVSSKIKRINEIKLAGFEVQHIIHRHGLDSETAFEVEAALIEAYPSITNVMGGQGNADRGVAHAREIIERYSAADASLLEPIIEININISGKDFSVYEATRTAWKVSLKRAEKALYAFAVCKGIVIEVFEIEAWLPATVYNFPMRLVEDLPGRYGFNGKLAPNDVRQRYIRHRMPKKLKGTANPLRYFNI